MIGRNIMRLRKVNELTQEELAEKLGVSRQVVAKWENEESSPDINKSQQIAELFDVKLDDLANYDEEDAGVGIPPKGKYFFGLVTVGERGQIVIPKEARDVFQIEAGDKVFVLGDETRGLAIVKESDIMAFMNMPAKNNRRKE